MDEMKERGLATKEEIASIFSNIPTLLDVHTGLLEVSPSSLSRLPFPLDAVLIVGAMQDLEQLKRDQGMILDDGIGKIFLDKTSLFKHYANYCVNHIGMSQKLGTLRENPKFVDFLEVSASPLPPPPGFFSPERPCSKLKQEAKRLSECRNLTLESFLITPLQRMVKYPLLLAVRVCPPALRTRVGAGWSR
jgi:hypothetical protein